MLAFISAAIAAVVFAAAGWLGTLLSEALYGAWEPEVDGPAAIVVPRWVFAAASAGVGLLVGLHGEGQPRVAILLLATLALTTCAATDFKSGMIPDLFSLGPLAVIVAVSAVQHDWAPMLGAFFAFTPFAAMATFSKGRGMGWGDVKLAALGGALVGVLGITLAVALASLIVYIVTWLSGRRRQPIAFGPYLAASIGVALAVGSTV